MRTKDDGSTNIYIYISVERIDYLSFSECYCFDVVEAHGYDSKINGSTDVEAFM